MADSRIWIRCLLNNKPVIYNDYKNMAHKDELPEGHFPLSRVLVVPVVRGNSIVAVLGVANKETDYKRVDIDSVQQLADIAWETIERKKTEEELKVSLVERQRLMSAIEQTHDTVVITDLEGMVLYTNPAFEMTSGYSKNEILGKNIGIVKSDKHDSGFYRDLWDSITDKKPWFGLIENRRKDGTLYTEEVYISPVLNKDSKIISYVGVKRDITHNLKLVQEKALLREQLSHRAKIDTIGHLAGGMAHDFNNILSGIVSAAQLLKSSSEELSGQSLKYIDLIFQASKRGSDLTSRLLSLGRKKPVSHSILDLNTVLEDIKEILNRTIDKRISIKCELNALFPCISGDMSSIQNAFINMGINASHAIAGEGLILFSLDNIKIGEDLYCQIEVRDNGSGIQEKYLRKIFEPFYTTKDINKGTGLGLSVVKETIEDHKGTISVKSTPGEGTSFFILFPCSSEDSVEVPAPSSQEIVTGNGTILFVDDEELNRITGEDILVSLGYDVLLAQDGNDAIRQFKNNRERIGLIILDMIMPQLNGTEAFYQLREIDSQCKIIVSSGYTDNEDIDKLNSNGLSGFIQKPYTVQDLSRIINKVLQS
jgi:PAS domain S-box-containing protein